MEDLLSGALLVLLVGGAVFAWADWRVRARKLPQMVGPSWDCPHCGVKNEAELGRCPMRVMHLCYAAIGFAVARWIFKRQAVADPVSRFRAQGLM